MDKRKLMLEVLGVFDENEKLTKENAELVVQLTEKKKAENVFEDLQVAGRKLLFEKVKSYSLDYRYDIEKDGKILTFFEWLETLDWEIFSPSYCKDLNNHSLHEVVYDYFMDELQEVYEKKLNDYEQKAKEKALKESD